MDSVGSTKDGLDPQRILFYSVQGLGKNTFGSTFEKPFVFQLEDGSGNVDMSTFRDEDGKPKIMASFDEVVEGIDALHGEHDFKTLVIDTLDWLEPLIWAKQMAIHPLNEKGNPVTGIEDYGYGKGYIAVLEWWRWFMGGLNSLRFKKGMTIVLLAHTDIKRYDSPVVDPYDRYQVKLNRHASAFWQEWADMVLFANYQTRVEKAEVGFNNTVTRGEGSGDRIIYTEERPAYHAKNRWGLSPEIFIGQDKSWSGFHCAFNEATEGRYILPGHLKPKTKPDTKKGEK
jgi:hypothetical protein